MTDLPQRTMTEQVMARLRDMILSGELAPGSRLDQNDLARRFGVSLVPLREALARLQSSGLVRIVPHRGVFVEALSVEELLDIYQVREALEDLASRLAAPRLSAADLATLDRLKIEMEQTAKIDDFDAFLDLHRDFHFTIYRAAGRRHLLQLLTQLWDLSARYRRFQLYALPGADAHFPLRNPGDPRGMSPTRPRCAGVAGALQSASDGRQSARYHTA
jgi:DNA-binding GntR family transcriptional regulator